MVSTNPTNTALHLMEIDVDALIADVQSKRKTPAKGDKKTNREKVYDPRGNLHCFNLGASKPVFDPKGKFMLKEYTKDETYMLDFAGGVFNTTTVQLYFEYNGVKHQMPNSHAVLRVLEDGKFNILTDGVTRDFNTMSYKDIIRIPEVATMTIEDGDKKVEKEVPFEIDLSTFDGPDGNNVVRDALQTQKRFEDRDFNENPKILVKDILAPHSCHVWQYAKQMNFNYLLFTFYPDATRPEEPYNAYLDISSSLDGSASTKYSLMIERQGVAPVVMVHTLAENMLHMDDNVVASVKRTSNMAQNAKVLHRAVMEALKGATLFESMLNAMSMTSPSTQADMGEYITKVFDINILDQGQGKRNIGTMEKILATTVDKAYGQKKKPQTWLDIYTGVMCWLFFDRQVNNLPNDEEGTLQSIEKLLYKLLVENDKAIIKAWKVLHTPNVGDDGKPLIFMKLENPTLMDAESLGRRTAA